MEDANVFRRTFVTALMCSIPIVGLAQSTSTFYPSGPISLVVPFAAGSGTDAVARIVAKKLGERLKQSVVVDNKAGANGQIAAMHVVKSKPDGLTLMMTTNTTHSANPSLVKDLKYDPIKDFTPVARVGELPFALLVNKADTSKGLKEWLEAARSQPNKLSYATPNSTSLVASETIKRIAKVDVLGVPYKSSPQALTDLVGGVVQMYVADLGSSIGMIKAGSVRALAVTAQQGSSLLPGVPPLSEAIPGFDVTSWNGVFGPAGLPKDVVTKLHAEIQATLADKEVQTQLKQLGFEVWPSQSPDDFAKYVRDQLAHWGSLIKQAGIRAE